MGEGDGGVRDELDREGGQQQSGDPGSTPLSVASGSPGELVCDLASAVIRATATISAPALSHADAAA
jgi:hypothetical protein